MCIIDKFLLAKIGFATCYTQMYTGKLMQILFYLHSKIVSIISKQTRLPDFHNKVSNKALKCLSICPPAIFKVVINQQLSFIDALRSKAP